jgi:hypothetical protein
VCAFRAPAPGQLSASRRLRLTSSRLGKGNGFSWSLGDLCWCRIASIQLGTDNCFFISSWVVRYATVELVTPSVSKYLSPFNLFFSKERQTSRDRGSILVLYVSPRANEAPLIELLVLVCTQNALFSSNLLPIFVDSIWTLCCQPWDWCRSETKSFIFILFLFIFSSCEMFVCYVMSDVQISFRVVSCLMFQSLLVDWVPDV